MLIIVIIMKKLLTLSFLVIALVLGTHKTIAQDTKSHPEVIAKEKTNKLTQEFGLDANQQRLVWRTFMAREKVKKEIENKSLSKKEIKEIYLKVDENFHNTMQKYLNEEQYKKFKKNIKHYL